MHSGQLQQWQSSVGGGWEKAVYMSICVDKANYREVVLKFSKSVTSAAVGFIINSLRTANVIAPDSVCFVM